LDKKTIALLVICILLLLFWGKITDYLGLTKSAPPPQTLPPTTEVDTIKAESLPPQPPPIVPGKTEEQLDTAVTVEALAPEKIIHIYTPLYDLMFTTRGGGMNQIVLLQYHYLEDGGVILAESERKVVPNFTANDGAFSANNLPFQCDAQDFTLRKGDEPRKITFTYDNSKGGRIVKSYTINADRYDIGFEMTVEGIETFGFERNYDLVWDITPPPSERNIKDDYGYFKVVGMMDDFVNLAKFADGRMSENIPGRTEWAGLRTKYFAAVMIAKNRQGDGLIARGTEHTETIDAKTVKARDLTAAIEMPISTIGTVNDSYLLYAGPIHYNTLKRYNVGLEELTSLGWVIIKPFSIAIIWLLPKIYSVIPNYGIVVLIFALLIKVIIYPLSRKQTIAMTKLKDLQPKMKKLQERYKSDPQRLNKEMMKLYKEAGANPLSGCLPLLPQMPLFFALFTVFKTTIEFRGASFAFWITDLSVKDPYYILPIIMVITMFFQQKLTMTDPKNKMMVYLMPLFFGWLFMNFPAGLVLYWTGFNILSLLETVFIRKKQMEHAGTVVEEKA
jgi:YidC/Oxa1 family membrane protein insertase